MTFDLDQEILSILAALPENIRDHNIPDPNNAGEMTEFRQQAGSMLAELQKGFSTLAGKSLGRMDKLYVFDPHSFIASLEQDVVKHWLQHPGSLELSVTQLAGVASCWYGQRVSAHRLKRRFKDPAMIQQLHKLCSEHGNPTDISKCRSLPQIQKRLKLQGRRTATRWIFKGEITFYDNEIVEIKRKMAVQDRTKSGKPRIRGNGSAIPIDALKNVLMAYTD
jgi:hypothetical protein